MNQYSVRLIFQSTHVPQTTGSFFEESIVVLSANSEEEAKKLVMEYYKPDSYENAEGGVTTVTLIKIVDIFEIMDSLDDSNLDFKEVYSQFLIYEDEVATIDDIMNRYNKLYGFKTR